VDCPWLPHQNPEYKSNLQALLTLQRFCRKNLRYWRIKNWVQTRECTEWFYDPQNMGGHKHIQRMGKFLSGLVTHGREMVTPMREMVTPMREMVTPEGEMVTSGPISGGVESEMVMYLENTFGPKEPVPN
jgi:hypothetical protein